MEGVSEVRGTETGTPSILIYRLVNLCLPTVDYFFHSISSFHENKTRIRNTMARMDTLTGSRLPETKLTSTHATGVVGLKRRSPVGSQTSSTAATTKGDTTTNKVSTIPTVTDTKSGLSTAQRRKTWADVECQTDGYISFPDFDALAGAHLARSSTA